MYLIYLLLVDGSASKPALAFSSAPDRGLYLKSGDVAFPHVIFADGGIYGNTLYAYDSNTTVKLGGAMSSSNTGVDVILESQNLRTAGDLVHIRNGSTDAVGKFDYQGNITISGSKFTTSSDTFDINLGAVPALSFDANRVATFSSAAGNALVNLMDGPNISTDASLANKFKVQLGGDRTLDNPTNIELGFDYTWYIQQDATGSRSLTYGTAFRWAGGVAPILTTTASGMDVIGGTCVSTSPAAIIMHYETGYTLP